MVNGKGGKEEMVAMVDDTLIRTSYMLQGRFSQLLTFSHGPFTRDYVHVFLTLGPKLIAAILCKGIGCITLCKLALLACLTAC